MRNWTILFIIVLLSFFSVACSTLPVASQNAEVVPDESLFRWAANESDKLGFNGEDVLVCVEPGTSKVVVGGSYLSTVYLNLFKVEGSDIVPATPLSTQNGKFEAPLEYQLENNRKLTLKMDVAQEGLNGISKRSASLLYENGRTTKINCYEQVADDSFRVKLKSMVTGALNVEPQ